MMLATDGVQMKPGLLYDSKQGNLVGNALRTFIGVETAALTFRTKQYSTSYCSHICYGKRFYNDFFLNHQTIALVNNFLSLVSIKPITTTTTTNFELKQSDWREGWLLNLIIALFLCRGRGICRVMETRP